MHGLLILICIFGSSFANIIAFAIGADLGFVMRVICAFTFFYSIYLFFDTRNDISTSKSQNVFWVSLFIVVGILLSMFIEDLQHESRHHIYEGMVLGFISKILVVPCIALAWNKRDYLTSVIRWILPFTFFFTFVMFNVVKKLGTRSYMFLEIGHQTLAYAAAFSIGLLLFFLKSNETKMLENKLGKKSYIISSLIIISDFFVILFAGGKGGFVLASVLIALFFSKYMKIKYIRPFSIIVFGLIVGLFYNISYFLNFNGVSRILSLFSSKDIADVTSGRNYIYSKAIEVIFERCFLGGGTGSVLYDVGYYAHNMFLDILVDWGFPGLFFCLGVVFIVVKKYCLMKYDDNIRFLFCIFIMHFIMLMFSGNFYANFGLWFSIITILMYENRSSVIQSKS